jgi:hypothetical protein
LALGLSFLWSKGPPKTVLLGTQEPSSSDD